MEYILKAFDVARGVFAMAVDGLARQCKDTALYVKSSEYADYLNYLAAAMSSTSVAMTEHSIMDFNTWRRTAGVRKPLDHE